MKRKQKKRLQKSRRRNRSVQKINHQDLGYELLEARQLLATYLVSNTLDTGVGSFRAAIVDANNNPGLDTINFNIGGGGIQTISLTTSLPNISDSVNIDATSQPAYSGSPLIELNGSLIVSNADGLDVDPGASTSISGLSIYGFTGHGILLASGFNAVAGNWIGVRASGVASGNGGSGVFIQNTPGNTIGSILGSGNVISNNLGHGILVNPAAGPGNTIVGNIIGLNPAGTADMGNALNGISLETVSGNTIGGTTASARNVISGNSLSGIFVTAGSNNLIQGNYIGTNADGDVAIGNSGNAISVSGGSTNNTIGGGTAGARNVISGSTTAAFGAGVLFSGVGTTGNTVVGNYIGTDRVGNSSVANSTGVRIEGGATGNTIGGTSALLGQSYLVKNGQLDSARDVAVEASGNLLVIENGDVLKRVDPTTGLATTLATADEFQIFEEVTVTSLGEVYVLVGDDSGTYIKRINPTTGDQTSLVLLSGFSWLGLAAETNGDLLAINSHSAFTQLVRINHVTGAQTIVATDSLIEYADDLAVVSATQAVFNYNFDSDGILYSVDLTNGVVTEISINGLLSDSAGGLAVKSGFAYVSNANRIIQVDLSNGSQSIYSAANDDFNSLAFLNSGELIGSNTFGDIQDNVVAFTGSASANVISGNTGSGVDISDFGTNSNNVRGNLIGTDGLGRFAVANATGVYISGQAASNTVGGTTATARNIISGNATYGVSISDLGTNLNVVSGNYIGTNKAGLAALPNSWDGVQIADGAASNTIGGTTANHRNLISGNLLSGVLVAGDGTDDNVISANWIGVNVLGTSAIANGNTGVLVTNGATGTIVGSSVAGAGNVISGNTVEGVRVENFSPGLFTTDTHIIGNMIGTNALGTTAIANATGVIIAAGSSGNFVGGTTANERNIISGNTQNGVRIEGAGTSRNLIQGNYIGTDITGSVDLGNAVQGISVVFGAEQNVIGGDAVGAGNVVSGNDFDGINITFANNNFVRGNIVGLAADGNTVLGNSRWGVYLDSSSTTVGSTSSRNIISGNGIGGVGIGSNTTLNVVIGNHIGTDITGTLDRGNVSHGVQILSAGSNIIGGSAVGAGNLISGNNQHGVYITGAASTNNSVLGNYIGTDVSGTLDLGNFVTGVYINNSSGTIIGGAITGAGNVISGNDNNGLIITGALSSHNLVQGNFIGTNAAGTAALGNTRNGISIASGATSNLIGGSVAGARNIVSGNLGSIGRGIIISGTGTSQNTVIGNYIGLNAAGTAAIANTNSGVLIASGATNNTIGGPTTGDRNVISGNALAGIAFSSSGTTGNVAQGNWIGVNAAGTLAVANQLGGIGFIDGSANNSAIGNVVSGNASLGIGFGHYDTTLGSNNNEVRGNFIGVGPGGTSPLPNTGPGINILDGSSGNTIGGTSAADRNIISANTTGISISGAGTSNNLVLGNYIGTDVTGTLARGNIDGVQITAAASGNTIGGTAAGAKNLISGNSSYGIYIHGNQTTNNSVKGNFIGTDFSGSQDLGNTVDGVRIDNAPSNAIGGTTDGAGNLISGNGNNGIGVFNVFTGSTMIEGNLIGTSADGVSAIGNSANGIAVGGSVNTYIGGNTPGARNVIAGTVNLGSWFDAGNAISITGASATVIRGNYLGTNILGTGSLGNARGGIGLFNDTGTLIGGSSAGEGNLISGNIRFGISGIGSTGAILRGNRIGTDASGTVSIGNGLGEGRGSGINMLESSNWTIGGASSWSTGQLTGAGNLISGHSLYSIQWGQNSTGLSIYGNAIGTDITGSMDISSGNDIRVGGPDVVIGGVTAELRNLISGNGTGIFLDDSDGAIVQGNYIGTDRTGQSAVGNGTGILVLGNSATNLTNDAVIGGTTAGAGNVISGNSNNGIYIGADDNFVFGNYIGTNAGGTVAIPNLLSGITIASVANNVIGGATAAARNVISGNVGDGIKITGASSANNRITGNFIGVDVTGTRPLANTGHGVVVSGANQIGTDGSNEDNPLKGNVISANLGSGISISEGNGSLIAGNHIGTDLTDQIALGNAVHGVSIEPTLGLQAQSHTIGGFGIDQNTIAYNGQAGIRIAGVSQNNLNNTIERNRYISNGTLGIDVANVGVTANQPNNSGYWQNYPVITDAYFDSNQLVVRGFSRPDAVFDLYIANPNASGFGEGRAAIARLREGVFDLDATTGTYTSASVGGLGVGTDTTNRFEYRMPIPVGVQYGSRLTAVHVLTTDVFPIASEFGNSIIVGDAPGFTVPGSSLKPVITLPSAATVKQGESLRVEGQFYDFDSTDWVATVNFGNGTILPLTIQADRTFVFEYTYAQAGSFTITVSVTDSSLATGVATMSVAVQNEVPQIDLNLVRVTTPVIEGQPVVVTGAFQDGLNSETHNVTVIWDDGQTTILSLAAGVTSFSASHTYSSRGPGSAIGAGVDIYRIQVSVADQATSSNPTPLGLLIAEVRNVLPGGLSATFSPTSINAGQAVTISNGVFTDPGLQDLHRVRVDWGDGSLPTILNLPIGQRTFGGISHVYSSAPRFGGTYTAKIELIDLDQPQSARTLTQTITVARAAVANVNLTLNQSVIDENESILLDGTFTDANLTEGHLVSVAWGDGTQTSFALAAGVTSFAGIAHQYLNNPLGGNQYTIVATFFEAEDVNVFTTASQSVTVNNLAPTLTNLLVENAAGGTLIREGETARLTGTIGDIGTLDRHTVNVNWGDGSFSAAVVDSASRTFVATHKYADNGLLAGQSFQISVSATDGDGGSVSASLLSAVVNVAPVVAIEPSAFNTDPNLIEMLSQVQDVPADVLHYQWTAFVAANGAIPQQTGTNANFVIDRSAAPSAVWTVQLSVTDDDGGVGNEEISFLAGTIGNDTMIINDATMLGVASRRLLVLGLAGQDVIDASGVTIATSHVMFDGGAGADQFFGGAGDDILFLRQGNDSVNVLGGAYTPINSSNIELGSDRFMLTPNSTLTVIDRVGANILDFGLAGFGITFDLSLNNTTSLTSQDVDPNGFANTHFVVTQGIFAELVGSSMVDALTAASNSMIKAGGGADNLKVGSNTSGAMLAGGADNDILTVTGTNISNLIFSGDDGVDRLENSGAIAALTFNGGADGDVLFNTGTVTGILNFGGDSGIDALTNNGAIGSLVFNGGADGDLLTNNISSTIASLNFGGDSGIDTLTNSGSIGSLTFTGGADNDILNNIGSIMTTLVFNGDDGIDQLQNSGTIAGLTFTGGADGDLLLNATIGTLNGLTFNGDDGVDQLQNAGMLNSLIFNGGADGDELLNVGTINGLTFGGDSGADILQNEGDLTGVVIFNGGADGDILNNLGTIATITFSGDDGANLVQNSGTISTLTFNGGADGDQLLNLLDAVISNLDFNGDAGADLLRNSGQINGLIFNGGADSDTLVNILDSVINGLDFGGDDGADTLYNAGLLQGGLVFNGGADDDTLINAGTMGALTFNGGADDDALLNDTMGTMGALTFGGDSGADLLINRGSATTIVFNGGADNDVLRNEGTTGGLEFGGDTGADGLVNLGSATTVVFTGGADNDALLNTATGSIGSIDFSGDSGADVLVNDGLVSSITFTGGADNDALINQSSAGGILFNGGADNDVLLNTGASVGSIDFGGDDGADILQNDGSQIGTINFQGDDGADVLINTGANVGSIIFDGGADDDLLISRGINTGSIIFTGDDIATQNGADIMILHGSGNGTATVQFTGLGGKDALQNNAAGFASLSFVGGADNDVLQNNAAGVSNIDFQGDTGADVLDNRGMSVTSIIFTGGSDNDTLINSGSDVTGIQFTGGADNDTLLNTGSNAAGINFGGDTGVDQLINTGANVSNVTFNGGADSDVMINAGLAANGIIFNGDNGSDQFINLAQAAGSSNLTFNGDAGADLLVNYAINVSGITFNGGADADVLRNYGYGAANINFTGDAGADVLVNTANAVVGIVFSGGADDDILFNSGQNLSQISFTGDSGADLLQNDGSSVAVITYTGGADDDVLINNGQSVGSITFSGDGGADILQNNGSATSISFTGGGDNDTLQNNASVGQITFGGGADNDTLLNNGDGVGSINFTGDAGSDSLANNGSNVASITFTGGADADVMRISGNSIGDIVFNGDGGADSFIHDAASVAGSVVTVNGGIGNDLVAWLGTGSATLNMAGGDGDDTVIVRGTGTLNLNGGLDNDYYLFQGNPLANVSIVEGFTGVSETSKDTLDFSAFSGGALNLDLRLITAQSQSGNLSIALSDGQGMENVYGTHLGDTIFGNSRDNLISGAEYLEPVVGPVAGQRANAQWVLLDFDTETDVAGGEHVYTASERNQIQSLMETSYHGPSSIIGNPSTWWFNVRFTQNVADIPAGSSYATILFNETPSSGRPGGEASEVDLGNLNLSGTAVVQVTGLLGGTLTSSDAKSVAADTIEGSVKLGSNKPDATSENFIALSAKIAAHELGHLMGLRHFDTYGPIGFGVHSTPGGSGYNPTYTGPAGAYEAIDHLLGSGASIGTTRFNDLRQLFFGEREAVKLAYANSNSNDVNVNDSATAHASIGTAQPLNMSTLIVPNTLSSGLNSAKVFSVQAAGVVGAIGLNGSGVSESDFYSFTGRRGELVNIELSSLSLRGNRNGVDLYFDSIIRVYDSSGALVSWFGSDAVNDDEFESSDSAILDLMLPADGTYFIEVDTFVRLPGTNGYQNAVDLRADLESRIGTLTAAEQDLLLRLQDSLDDTDIGNYQMFVYRFSHANADDGVETIKGNGGTDIIIGGPGDDFATVIEAQAAATADSGVLFTRTITFTDRAASSWTATVDYGDGTGLQSLNVTLDGLGRPQIELSHVYASNGGFLASISITNDIGITTVGTLEVLVADIAPVVNIVSVLATDNSTNYVEGNSVTVNLTSADPSNASISLTTNWSVYRNGSATAFASGTGVNLTNFTFTPNDNGSYEIRVKVTDEDGDMTTVSQTITVSNVAPVINTFNVPATGNQGSSLNFAATASDAGVNDTLTYLWNFGDGTTVNGATASHVYTTSGIFTVTLTVTDNFGAATISTASIAVASVGGPPTASNSTLDVVENTVNTTVVGTATATSPGGSALTYSLTGGTGLSAFAINPTTGEIRVVDGSLLDFETTSVFTLVFTVTNASGQTASATVTIQLLNQASITGAVFVDVNGNGLMNANESGVNGVLIQLLDQFGNAVLGGNGQPITSITSDGGFYLFEDLNPGTYRIREIQPTGVSDGAEILGSLGGTFIVNDTMQLTLIRTDAEHYNFAELGQQLTSGDTAGIGFWQNKHGQALIKLGGTALANWLTSNFGNVFGNTFTDGVGGDNGNEVAKFYKEQLFKKKAQHGSGPAKVDAQFMATALATYFTSSILAGNVAISYGFNVTQTGIGTKIVNIGNRGAAFNVANGTSLTIMQLLSATNNLTDSPNCITGAASIYDLNGDGVISCYEAWLRTLANDVYSSINGD